VGPNGGRTQARQRETLGCLHGIYYSGLLPPSPCTVISRSLNKPLQFILCINFPQAHSEFKDDDAFNKALKRVKHKRFVSDGLKNIPKHRKKLLDKLNTDKILENKDTSSGDKSQWRDEGHRQRSTTETEGRIKIQKQNQ